ncbi:glutamyl-tRNA reductase [Nocardioides daedukensis]|uniref:Glutamyl-tRNA reductase n=1 Tax=Nocardioides daedukensis TaxID=634462 RepID=A0A7Y9UNT4_9ACTN|nr:glutamyl-tRNA reductase [Nocardioides daedukensis]
MSILVVGISHRTAPVEVLEQLSLEPSGVDKLIADVTSCEHVTEAAVLATCNRLEIYAEVDRFHGSVEELSRLLCERGSEFSLADNLLSSLYVHYDDGAVSHLFHVVSGLDSMVVGEGQILGQAREALRHGQEVGTVGPALNSLFQQALRVGKRSHAETDIDRAAPSMVTAALDLATVEIGSLADKRVAVVGAGAMAGLATATVSRLGAADIAVLNRTASNADRLAGEYSARALALTELHDVLAQADVVISCTGASGVVITTDQVAAARAGNLEPIVFLDLALPRDIEEGVAALPGVTVIDLRRLADELSHTEGAREVEGVRSIVTEEIRAFVNARRQASVTPTVVALRTMATGVVDAEIERLLTRLPELDPASRAEVEQAVRRVADKLLHQPTIRVKELANETGAVSYATALAELFALHPDAVDAVTSPERHS